MTSSTSGSRLSLRCGQTTFEKGRSSLPQIQEFVTHFFNGGTHFEKPLREAIDVVKRYERAGKPKPDILFLTDGACSVPSGLRRGVAGDAHLG